ncbi:hypothetical protein MAR_020430 [Mya arenaria]|uniref:Ig-like domain-containing protein n=1 Tax=Mya arenaria TaxID=6604 RepID=A0ABY7E814_MYAAR|nr:hypothetical protein MAR_020430 [Mya arenaria]
MSSNSKFVLHVHFFFRSSRFANNAFGQYNRKNPPESVSIRHESESGTVIQSEFRVIEGNATRLFCSVQSQPVSSFSWSGAGFHSRDPPKLQALPRKNALEGNGILIQCSYTVGNPMTTKFEVSAFPNQNIVTINESERLSIVCEVTSNPNSTIRLKQTHMTIALMERDNVLGLEYAIQNASCSDAAVYTCAAFNNYTDMERASSKDMQLFVRYVPPGQNGDSADNPGYDAAEMYEQVQAKKETPVYDDLNDGNDRPDHSHLYTPLEESNPRSSIHYENVKREDPIYHNMVM